MKKINTQTKTIPKSFKKPTKAKLIKKLDITFSEYIRKRYASKSISKCVTCGKKDHWKKMQAGHFISRTKYPTRWNEDNVQVQCVACNRYRQGEQFKFSIYLGYDRALRLLEESENHRKFSYAEIESMIEHCQSEIRKLNVK